MAFNYEKLYASQQQALGTPTQVFVDFFNAYEKADARVLDIGCGQGRDALFIARLGHRVVGVDLSPSGIRDMNASAQAEGLDIEGIVSDITVFQPDGMFDVILIDRTLHMLPDPKRYDVLAGLLAYAQDHAEVLIADEASHMTGFKAVFNASAQAWTATLETKSTLFMRRL